MSKSCPVSRGIISAPQRKIINWKKHPHPKIVGRKKYPSSLYPPRRAAVLFRTGRRVLSSDRPCWTELEASYLLGLFYRWCCVSWIPLTSEAGAQKKKKRRRRKSQAVISRVVLSFPPFQTKSRTWWINTHTSFTSCVVSGCSPGTVRQSVGWIHCGPVERCRPDWGAAGVSSLSLARTHSRSEGIFLSSPLLFFFFFFLVPSSPHTAPDHAWKRKKKKAISHIKKLFWREINERD